MSRKEKTRVFPIEEKGSFTGKLESARAFTVACMQWLLDVYDKLDDPEVNLVTWYRFEAIQREDEEFLHSSK